MQYIYKTTFWRKLGGLSMFAVMGIGILAAFHNYSKNNGSLILFVLICAVISTFIIKQLTQQIRISDYGIEQCDIFRRRTIPQDNIAGWCVIKNRGRHGVSYSIQVRPKDQTRSNAVTVSSTIKIDDIFKAWITKYPNLTTGDALIDYMMSSPKFAEKLKTPEVAAKLAEFEKSRSNTPPDKMAESYFAQWGL